jgi:hypothetical protein
MRDFYSPDMREIWRRVFHSLTQGADMGHVLVKSLWIALLSTLIAVPYFLYLIYEVSGALRFFSGEYRFWGFLFTELFILFLVCFLSAMVGLSFSKKMKLPGFGDPNHLIHFVPVLLLIGVSMVVVSFFLFDRHFFKISPVSYPGGVFYLILLPCKEAFTDEIILRFCLVTLCVGVTRHKGIGIVLASAIASSLTLKYFHFIGIPFSPSYLFVTRIMLSFFANLLLGYLFVSRGLYFSMTLKLFLGMRYVVIVSTLG